MNQQSKTGKKIVRSMKRFLRDIKRGKAITVTRVERHETPDGPMHTFTKIKRKF